MIRFRDGTTPSRSATPRTCSTKLATDFGYADVVTAPAPVERPANSR